MKRFEKRSTMALALLALLMLPLAATAQGFDCLVEPWQVVEVRAPADGIIASIAVQRGDAVRRGQPLVLLQSEAEKLAVELARQRARTENPITAARTRVEYATKKHARLADLQKNNFISAQLADEADTERRLAEAELQSAVESREMAKIELRRAEELLALRTMSSPFNGVVVDRMLNPGDLAESGSGRKPVLKVAQIDPMRVDVPLPAALFGSVKVGAKATVMPVVGGGRFAASVRGVDRLIDAASGTFVVRLEVPNPEGKVPGGARCSATVDGVTAPAVPKRNRLGVD